MKFEKEMVWSGNRGKCIATVILEIATMVLLKTAAAAAGHLKSYR